MNKMGRIKVEFSDEDKLLFERINARSREAVKRLNRKMTAQELIDNA